MNDMNLLQTIPARRGLAVSINKGQALKIINTHGHQVIDFWAFNLEDIGEFLSMEHSRATLTSIFPKAGDALVTNRRRPILRFLEDSSPGNHDTLMAACDTYRYELLGCTDYHDNCTDNLDAAMRTLGHAITEVPSPLNLWMNIPVSADGTTGWGEPISRPGDFVIFEAVIDCIAAMSACPQDILPVNKGNPTEAHCQILANYVQ
ncbi:MAG: DUF1989 domain-containing protein [Hyphomicrobiaceae bacterium]